MKNEILINLILSRAGEAVGCLQSVTSELQTEEPDVEYMTEKLLYVERAVHDMLGREGDPEDLQLKIDLMQQAIADVEAGKISVQDLIDIHGHKCADDVMTADRETFDFKRWCERAHDLSLINTKGRP